jgi:hypothetical protein
MGKRGAIIVVIAAVLGIPAAASAQIILGGGGGAGGSAAQLSELTLLAQLMTPFTILTLGVIALWFFVRRQRRNEQQNEVADLIDKSQPNAGYRYFDVPDEFKSIFADGMQGFTEYAKLKGYSVALAVDSTVPGKVGVKFVIEDSGVTVSTAKVTSDLQEYAKRVWETEDFEDMPVVTDPIQHKLFMSAITARMEHLKQQKEFHEMAMSGYRRLFEGVTRMSPMIGYLPSTNNISIINQGERNTMGDNYKAENSPGAAVGKGNIARIESSSVVVGSSNAVRTEQGAAIATDPAGEGKQAW